MTKLKHRRKKYLGKIILAVIMLPVISLTSFIFNNHWVFNFNFRALAAVTNYEIIYYDGASCPSGWSQINAVSGRYIVGLPSGGSLDGTDGTALGNLEDRPTGQYTFSVDPPNTNVNIFDPGHSHTADTWRGANGTPDKFGTSPQTASGLKATTDRSTTGITATVDIAPFNTTVGSVPGTNAPYIQLQVCGIPVTDPNAGQLPPNAVVFFDGTNVPTGFSEYTQARGRYIVGLPSGGTIDGTDGSTLGNLEDRPTGQHTITVDPPNTSVSIFDPGHSHTADTWRGANGTPDKFGSQPQTATGAKATTDSSTTGITATVDIAPFNTTVGSVPGTNAPYIQLLVIKNTSGTNQALPINSVVFYEGTSTPTGFSEFTSARGRYIVGLPSGGSLDGTDGNALSNLEDRPTGQHNISIDPPNTSVSIFDPGHSHTADTWRGANGTPDKFETAPQTATGAKATTDSSTTGITATVDIAPFNTTVGSVPGTNAPYIQLLAIKKVDITPPTVSVSGPVGVTCVTPSNLGANSFSAFASDMGSGVQTVNFNLYDTANPSTAINSSPIPGTLNSGTSGNGEWKNSAAFPTQSMTTGHTYFVKATATDFAGNSATSSPSATYEYDDTFCYAPYIKTGSGDVHSQGTINTPGGPP